MSRTLRAILLVLLVGSCGGRGGPPPDRLDNACTILDQVLTGGGLVGKVTRVDEHYADIELAPNVKVKAVKSTISDVVDPKGPPPAND